jgi:hypothetical protein
MENHEERYALFNAECLLSNIVHSAAARVAQCPSAEDRQLNFRQRRENAARTQEKAWS